MRYLKLFGKALWHAVFICVGLAGIGIILYAFWLILQDENVFGLILMVVGVVVTAVGKVFGIPRELQE